MFKILLALHLVFAVAAVGPLIHAATTAGRGVRKGNAEMTAASVRMLRLYGIASVLVIITGFALMSANSPFGGGKVGEIGQVWVWLSLVLWVVAVVLILAVLVPTLDRATTAIAKGDAVTTLTARVAATGGVVGLIFLGIVFLMVYRPGR